MNPLILNRRGLSELKHIPEFAKNIGEYLMSNENIIENTNFSITLPFPPFFPRFSFSFFLLKIVTFIV